MYEERTLDGMKPMLHVNVEQLPEIAEWEIGEEYEIKLKVKQKDRMEMEGMPMHSNLEVMKMEVV